MPIELNKFIKLFSATLLKDIPGFVTKFTISDTFQNHREGT